MKKSYLIFFIIILQSCKVQYYGYVFDINTRRPIDNVTIFDPYNNANFKTDIKGKFLIEKSEIIDLIFVKNGYLTDTIPSTSFQSGEFKNKNFQGDTIYLRPVKID